jgi:hypothetical protein
MRPEIATTDITASTISEIFFIPDLNGNIDVYIPITASGICDETEVSLSGDAVLSWCRNISFLYAKHQPQGNVWFLHFTLDRYEYDVVHPELKDRTVNIHVELVDKHGAEPIAIDHTVVQSGCEKDESEICALEFCSRVSGNIFRITQDCSVINKIDEEYNGTKTHVLTQEC